MCKLLLLLLLIIVLLNIFSVNTNKEAFVPKNIKTTYRPIHRHIRINYEGFYNKNKINISNIFRKFGIL